MCGYTGEDPSWFWFVLGVLVLSVLIGGGMCVFMARQRDNIMHKPHSRPKQDDDDAS